MSTNHMKPDLSNERAVIRAAMGATLEQLGELVTKVKPENFMEAKHRLVWQALVELCNAGLRYQSGDTVKGVEPSYLTELEALEVPSNVEYHVMALGWDATRRDVLAKVLSQEKVLGGLNSKDPMERAGAVLGLMREGRKILYYMGPRRHVAEPEVDAMVAALSGIHLEKVVSGDLTPTEYTAVQSATDYLGPLSVLDRLHLTHEQLLEVAREGGYNFLIYGEIGDLKTLDLEASAK